MEKLIFIVAAVAVLAIAACSESGMDTGESESGGEYGERISERSEGSGEHGDEGEGSEKAKSGTEDGEEDATQYGLGDTFDQLRAGSRLIVSYNATDNAFLGTVENVSETTLDRVRVEIHLSNGVELGPTPSIDLSPGEFADVRLDATSQPFDTWSAHAEVAVVEKMAESMAARRVRANTAVRAKRKGRVSMGVGANGTYKMDRI